uniref:Major capsid protein N-terminal domain-containing protein n=1 Tax=viral metagenome TaxID=1070528 RepID=A0A6C0K097_9ZZZZ
MTGGGLLVIIAYGSQNVILSGNPQMTYYYKLFKRYSHFSMESVTTALDGPNQLRYDQPIQLRTKIQRIGDLMSDMYFSFQVPDIYSKYIAPGDGIHKRSSQYEFFWSRFLGAAIIQNVAFFIGGQKIQEFDGTYLLSKAQLEYDTDTYQKWSILVGDVPELTNPANGAYTSASRTGYPTVIRDTNMGQQLNRPSILGQDIHVPLNFWFTDATSQALPLVALQYQDCEVQITLNPANTLYSVLDASGYRVGPDFKLQAPKAEIDANNPAYGVVQDVSGQLRNFLTDVGYYTESNTWFLNPRIQTTYVYLSDDERQTFAKQPLTYIFPQVYKIPYEGIFQTRQTLDLDIHNPITRFIFSTRRSDSIYRNDFNNFTNWYTYPYAPLKETVGVDDYLRTGATSGGLIANSQKDIIKYVRIICDGNEIQEQKPTDFFTKITPYRYTSGITNAEIPIYTWAITSSKIQPSGSLNASRVKNLQAEIEFHTLPLGTNYTYNLTIYVESINFLVIASGSGAPKYAL